MRGFDSDKYGPPLGADRTATLEIVGYGAANVWSSGMRSIEFALPRTMISPARQYIVQPEVGCFARPYTKRDQHGQNGDVPAAAPGGVVA
jgi:hypothetical protein